MPTPFSFEHVFHAESAADVLRAYWNPAQLHAQDRALAIVERSIVDFTDGPDERVRVCRVVPKRQLPALVRPFVSGTLHYAETARWHKRRDEIEVEIVPSFLGGRAVIRAGKGLIRRTYAGSVSVDVALISSRIERGIVAEFERSMPLAAEVTQRWLDGVEPAMSARA